MFATRAFAPAKCVMPAARRSVSVRAENTPQINPSVRKDEPKVVDFVNVADIEKQAVYCRCWRSGTFPLCDGTHAKYNKETGDNLGPLIIKAAP